MVQEVPVDRNLTTLDGERGHAEPVSIGMAGRLARRPLAKEYDVGDDCRAFAFEGIRWKADGSQKIRLGCKPFADGGILFVEREVRRDQCQHTARLQGIDGLGEEIIVQR